MAYPSVVLGSLDLQTVEAGGVQWITESVIGWDDGVVPTLEVMQKPRANGAWAGASFNAARHIAASGTVIGPSDVAVLDAISRLKLACSLSGVELIVDEGDGPLSATVRRSDQVLATVSGLSASWSIQVVAVDPRKFGVSLSGSTGLPSSSGGLTLGTVSYTNLHTNPRPAAGTTTAWLASSGESIAAVTDGGEPAVELTDPVGGGGPQLYAANGLSGSPGVGRWVAFGIDLKPLTADMASGARIYARVQNGGTTVAMVGTAAGAGVTLGAWSRVVVSVQQTATADSYSAFVWPNAVVSSGAILRARKTVIAFGDTQAAAESAVATFFDGDTVTNMACAWTGTAGASTSTALTGTLTVPFTIDATTVSGQVLLTNPGNTAGPVVVRLDGPLTGPVVTHVESGLRLAFSPLFTINSGEWVVIDMEAHSVLAQGQSSRSQWIVSRGWSGLEVGSNTWALTAASGTGSMSVTTRPSWQ